MRYLKTKSIYISILLLIVGYKPLSAQTKAPYFQQHVAYTIHVALDDVHHILRADETIQYTNNSPVALSEIYFHLWPNGYRNNRTPFARQRLAEGLRDFHDAKKSQRGYIDSIDFIVDGKEVPIEYMTPSHEIAKLKLSEPLQPGHTITISTPFKVKIPFTFSRLGHTEQAYYISQWYPKPAVYDRNGWNTFPYLDQGEFYSEYGSFDVFITLPENYVVGATGRLMNASERTFLDKRAKQTEDSTKGVFGTLSTFTIPFSKTKKASSFPASSKNMKTIEYVQDSVHDFAWFADKRYLVEKTDTVLASGRKVTCWAMYTPDNKNSWEGSAKSVAKTIGFYSQQVGEYPYTSATAVSGDLMPSAGGMEYPMVTLVSVKSGVERVIVHEVGHNWFYGILGSNERQHPWMDEGINSFYEAMFYDSKQNLSHYFEQARKPNLLGGEESALTAGTYMLQARLGLDQAIDLPATAYTPTNYGVIVYGKTPMVLHYLYFYLGEKEFSKLMHQYFDQWKYKHPMPEDIKAIFEKGASKDVSMFFGDLISTDKKLDYAITKVKIKDGNYVLTVKNNGQITAPVAAAIGTKDMVLADTVAFSSAKKYDIILPAVGKPEYADINPYVVVPDVYSANSHYSLDPSLGRYKPIRFQAFIGTEQPNKTNVLLAPAVAWNDQDKWMLGLGLCSDLLPPKRLTYELLPMYAFGSNTLVGMGKVEYSFNPYDPTMRHFIHIGVDGKRFSFSEAAQGTYTKVRPFVSWEFQQKPFFNSMQHEITLSSAHIFNHIGSDISGFPTSDFPERLMVNELKYIMHKGPSIRSFYADADFQNVQGKVNSLSAQIVLHRPSPIRNQLIYFRVFAGTLLSSSTTDQRYFIPLSGIGGYQDFAYDNLYLDRAGRDRVFGQQIAPGGGDFKFINNTGAFSTNKWMITSSANVNIPKWPIRIYADWGTYADPDNNIKMEYSGGLSFFAFADNFEVYFPLFFSNDLNTWLKSQHPGYGRLITFRINFNALEPSKLVRLISGS